MLLHAVKLIEGPVSDEMLVYLSHFASYFLFLCSIFIYLYQILIRINTVIVCTDFESIIFMFT